MKKQIALYTVVELPATGIEPLPAAMVFFFREPAQMLLGLPLRLPPRNCFRLKTGNWRALGACAEAEKDGFIFHVRVPSVRSQSFRPELAMVSMILLCVKIKHDNRHDHHHNDHRGAHARARNSSGDNLIDCIMTGFQLLAVDKDTRSHIFHPAAARKTPSRVSQAGLMFGMTIVQKIRISPAPSILAASSSSSGSCSINCLIKTSRACCPWPGR